MFNFAAIDLASIPAGHPRWPFPYDCFKDFYRQIVGMIGTILHSAQLAPNSKISA